MKLAAPPPLFLLLLACSTPTPAPSPAPAPAPAPAHSPAPAPSPSPAPAPAPAPSPAPAPAPTWPITQTSFGPLQLGIPLPHAITSSSDLASQYTTTFYADAQPLEGFTLSDPPAFVVVKGGPFADWGMNNPGKKPPELLKTRALNRARAGVLTIDMIVITDPRAKTANGAFVSQDLAGFMQAYPGALRKGMPGLWEEPSCVAEQDGLFFFFDRCDVDTAKIVRIVVRKP